MSGYPLRQEEDRPKGCEEDRPSGGGIRCHRHLLRREVGKLGALGTFLRPGLGFRRVRLQYEPVVDSHRFRENHRTRHVLPACSPALVLAPSRASDSGTGRRTGPAKAPGRRDLVASRCTTSSLEGGVGGGMSGVKEGWRLGIKVGIYRYVCFEGGCQGRLEVRYQGRYLYVCMYVSRLNVKVGRLEARCQGR